MNSTRHFPRTASTSAPRQRTENQLNFLVDLVTQIGAYDAERGRELWFELRDQDQAGLLTFTQASDTISALKDERNGSRLAQHVDPREDRASIPEIPQGRYAVETSAGELRFYFVRVKDGYTTVKVYASDVLHEIPRGGQIALLRKIEAVGIEAARNRYADETKHCWMCGLKLTDPESLARKVGPDCAKKL